MEEQTNAPADFSARIRAGRAYADMSQGELANALGMSLGYVKMVEAGKGLKLTEQRALLEMLPEITGLPRSFFAGEPEPSRDDQILATLQEIKQETTRRYDELERWFGRIGVEQAIESVRRLAAAAPLEDSQPEQPPASDATDRPGRRRGGARG